MTAMFEQIDREQLHEIQGGNGMQRFGENVGFGAGVAVTAALRYVPGWNTQVPGQAPGFQRRHEAVVGPQISSYSDRQPAGAWRDFTAGVGAGATAAPGWSFANGY